MVRCFERLEMNRYSQALWPPLIESLPAVLKRDVAWSWRLDTRPMVDRNAPRGLVIVFWEVMNWSSSSWASLSAAAMVVR
jgi:hypothetical protein